jgi:hypothetical protein
MAYYTLYFLTFAVVICGTGMSDAQAVYPGYNPSDTSWQRFISPGPGGCL